MISDQPFVAITFILAFCLDLLGVIWAHDPNNPKWIARLNPVGIFLSAAELSLRNY